MPRPEFPNPPCILTPGMISRINSEQQHYDEDPERAEAEQESAEQRREVELEQELLAEQQQFEDEQEFEIEQRERDFDDNEIPF